MQLRPHATVLLVEDHREVRTVLARALRKARMTVVEVETATAAREALIAGQVDAVITDIALPGSVNGAELGRWIRFRFAAMPMLFITGLTHGEVIDQIVHDPFTRVLCKPFSIALLVQQLQVLLTGPPQPARS